MRLAEIEAAAYHRNGISGAGFYVGIVGASVEGEDPHPFLVVGFPVFNEDGEEDGFGDEPQVAAFDLELLAKHDVEFGSNSWRGDHFVTTAELIMDAVKAR